jgi:hypothetical protein
VNARGAKLALACAWLATASMFAFWFVWTSVEQYRASKSAPPGWIVDYFTPWPITIIGWAGFWGLAVVALVTLVIFIRAKFSN